MSISTVTILTEASILSCLALSKRLPISSTPKSLQSIFHLEAIKIFQIINYPLKSLLFAPKMVYSTIPCLINPCLILSLFYLAFNLSCAYFLPFPSHARLFKCPKIALISEPPHLFFLLSGILKPCILHSIHSDIFGTLHVTFHQHLPLPL